MPRRDVHSSWPPAGAGELVSSVLFFFFWRKFVLLGCLLMTDIINILRYILEQHGYFCFHYGKILSHSWVVLY